jgi:peptidoglycan biosynthesis protein MviN/MurJ (putative lipid II flippase)
MSKNKAHQDKNHLSEDLASKDTASIGQRIVQGAIVVGFMWIWWKFGGFLLNQVVNYYYGADKVYDAGNGTVFGVFAAVYKRIIYLFFFSSLLKIFKPAFMPLFAERMHRKSKEAAWELANTVVNLLLLGTLALGIISSIYAPEIISAQLPSFGPEQQAAAVEMFRWMLPGVLVMAFSIAALAILSSYKQFAWPAAADALQKFLWAGSIIACLSLFGISKSADNATTIIGASFLVGSLGQAVLLFIGLRKALPNYRLQLPCLSWFRIGRECIWALLAITAFLASIMLLRASIGQDSDNYEFAAASCLLGVASLYGVVLYFRTHKSTSPLARFAALASPILIATLIARYCNFGETRLESVLTKGDFDRVEQARQVALMPTVLFGYALSIVMIPFLADLAAQKKRDELGELVGRTIRFMLLFFIPLAMATIILSKPVMQFVWDHHGIWTEHEAGIAAKSLAIMAIIIPILAIEHVITQAFFSLQRTVLPAILGATLALLQSAVLYYAYDVKDWHIYALTIVCIAEPLRRIIKNSALLLFLRRAIPLGRAGEATLFAAQLLVICAVMACVAWGGLALSDWLLPLGDHIPPPNAAETFVMPGWISWLTDRLPGSLQEKANSGGVLLRFACVRGARLAIPSLASLAAFVILCSLFRIQEFLMVSQWVRERIPSGKRKRKNKK